MVIPNPSRSRGLRVARPSRDARQYQTHLNLLAHTSARLRASLDAIIVPASRPAVNLDHAVTLARALRCQLVVLCSLKARADEVNELLALRNFTRAIAVDLADGYTHPKLDFATSTPGILDFPGKYINPNGDLSTKRNLGLLLARMLGWERIFFMDDDIRDLEASSLHEVASMLGPCRAVGMRAVDFPDNSVVCHGHRETGGYQDIFVSGSVLAVHCTQAVTFFPEIYNEDWFFFYDAAADQRLGRYGRDATQLFYDPFADPQRAAGQEFGDVMAEGLYGLLHHRIGADRAISDYWQVFLDSRMRFLEGVLARSEEVEPYLRSRIASSIETAMTWTQQIKPSMCEQYVALWRQDLTTWERRLKDVPRLPSVNATLRELDLTPSARNPYVLAGIIGESKSGASKNFTAGMTARVPSHMASSAPFFTPNAAPVGQGGGRFGRGVLSRVGRIAREYIHRAIVALAEPPRQPTIASRKIDRPAVGRHRSPEFRPALPPNYTGDPYSEQAAFLAELSKTA